MSPRCPTRPLYTKVFFTDNFRFQYPPSALFGLAAMLAVDPERVQINDVYDGAWPATNTVVGWFFIFLTAASVAALLELGLAAMRPDVDWRQHRALRALVVVGLTLTFYPVVKAFTLGQIQVWINAPVRARPARLGSGVEGIERRSHRRHQPHQAALRAVPGMGHCCAARCASRRRAR